MSACILYFFKLQIVSLLYTYTHTITHVITISDFLQMLFAELTKQSQYMDRVEHFCDMLLTKDSNIFTKKGLLYVSNRHTLSYAANAAFICLIAVSSDDYENTFEYYTFAKQQIHYMLGIGTGKRYKKYHIVGDLRITKYTNVVYEIRLKIVCIKFFYLL